MKKLLWEAGVYTWKKAKGSKEKANSAASTSFHMGLHSVSLSCLVPPSPLWEWIAQHPPTPCSLPSASQG